MGQACEDGAGLGLQETDQIQRVNVHFILALPGAVEFSGITLGDKLVEACLRCIIHSEFSNLLNKRWCPTAYHWLYYLFQSSMFGELLHAAILPDMRRL